MVSYSLTDNLKSRDASASKNDHRHQNQEGVRKERSDKLAIEGAGDIF